MASAAVPEGAAGPGGRESQGKECGKGGFLPVAAPIQELDMKRALFRRFGLRCTESVRNVVLFLETNCSLVRVVHNPKGTTADEGA